MRLHSKRYLPILILTAVVIQVHFVDESHATTKRKSQFTCPVCENRFDGFVLSSTNTFGGQDRDFLTRARGDQPVLIYPKTCPECFYSGYPADFKSVSEVVKEQILRKGALKPMHPISKEAESYEIPASVRYDLIAQTYRLIAKPEKTIAHQFLSASWATRMESALPLVISGKEVVTKLRRWKRDQSKAKAAARRENPVLLQIQNARDYVETAKSSEGEVQLIAVLAAIETFRLYGENTEAENALPILNKIMPETQFSEFEKHLNESIARERHFQRKALLLFERVVQTEEDEKEKACLTYLCGELHRRLENWDKSRKYYIQCLQIEGRPSWLEKLVREQRELLPD
ncbi:MAG: DUF2225 domain-containing protein [Planctomycetota bacterium]|jgi:uncharacterized protein (DUF2225 family)